MPFLEEVRNSASSSDVAGSSMCNVSSEAVKSFASDYRTEKVFLAGNGSFISILGSIGAWVGSSTVQHMIGLSLTRPGLAILGPVGFVGAFGIFQVGLKAAMNSAQLSAFGWSADQSPARGVRESLTVGVSESDEIHFGLGVSRQQTQISPLGDNGWNVQCPEKGQLFQQFSILDANGMMKNTYVNCKFPLETATFHSNMTWLGKRKGCFVTCKDELSLQNQLIWCFFMTVILCSILVSSVIIAEIFMITGAVLVSETQVLAYGATKLFSIFLLHLEFLLKSYPNMPGDPCSDGKCVPARLRLYRQKRTTSGGENGTAFVYCNRSYRVVQGIDHPSLGSKNKNGSSYFIYGEDKIGDKVYRLKRRKVAIKTVEWAAAIFGLIFLFFYAWYVSWLVDNARALGNSSFKLYVWSAIEYILLGGKIVLMATRSDYFTLDHGKDVNLALRIGGSVASVPFTNHELLRGALVEASGKHIIKAHAQMAYQMHNKLCAIHISPQSEYPAIGCFHVVQDSIGAGTHVSIYANTERGIFTRKLDNPKGSQKGSQFAIKGKEGKLYLGIQKCEGDEWNDVLPIHPKNTGSDILEIGSSAIYKEGQIRTFSISILEHELATGKKIPGLAMHSESKLQVEDANWYALSTKEAIHTIDEVQYIMESINITLTAALLTNRQVFSNINPEEHGMCSYGCK